MRAVAPTGAVRPCQARDQVEAAAGAQASCHGKLTCRLKLTCTCITWLEPALCAITITSSRLCVCNLQRTIFIYYLQTPGKLITRRIAMSRRQNLARMTMNDMETDKIPTTSTQRKHYISLHDVREADESYIKHTCLLSTSSWCPCRSSRWRP